MFRIHSFILNDSKHDLCLLVNKMGLYHYDLVCMVRSIVLSERHFEGVQWFKCGVLWYFDRSGYLFDISTILSQFFSILGAIYLPNLQNLSHWSVKPVRASQVNYFFGI